MVRKVLIGAFCALAIVACSKTVDGLLTNKEALTFNVKKGASTIPAGRWNAQIKIVSKKEVQLAVAIPGQNSAVEASFKVPKHVKLPQGNGTFELESQDSGQPYDVQGEVSSTHEDSPERWETEPCSYQVQHQVCNHGPNGPVCWTEIYTVQGWRDSRYFVRDTVQKTELNLLNLNKTNVAGNFNATDRYSERIYTYQSACR